MQIPTAVGLPWWATAILLVLFITSGVINLVQLSKGREVARWKSASEVAEKTVALYEKQLTAVRDRADRIDSENKNLLTENATLHAKTDLSRLQAQSEDFQRDNQKVQSQIVDGLAEVSRLSSERFADFGQILTKNTEIIRELGLHMTSEFEFHKKAFADISSVLQAMDRRLPAATSA
jgi:septal ring factor EnvC (AmiA/AmiB activator)